MKETNKKVNREHNNGLGKQQICLHPVGTLAFRPKGYTSLNSYIPTGQGKLANRFTNNPVIMLNKNPLLPQSVVVFLSTQIARTHQIEYTTKKLSL